MTATHRHWLVAVAAMLPTTLEALDAFIANVALRHIRGSLAAAPDEVTGALTTYLVASAVMVPLSGWLARRLGAKRLFLCATALFTLGSYLAGSAGSLAMLIGARIVQGLGGGVLIPLSQ